MSKVLDGKVAVVTGSGQGVGRSIAILFAKQGAKVVTNNRMPGSTPPSMVTDEHIKKLPEEKQEWFKKGYAAESGDAETTAQTIRDMGGEATAVFCDISKIEDAGRLIQTAVDTYGRIDILCNVAGGFGFSDIENISPELWDHVNDIKPRGYFYTMKYAIPYMRKQKYGRIILCSSIAFTGGVLKHAEYCAANAAAIGLTRAAAYELYADGITVNCFAPAARTRAAYELEAARLTHDSPIIVEGRSFIDIMETPSPDHVAPFVTYLASEKAARVNGSVFLLMGNMVGLFANPVIETRLMNDSEEPWDVDELFEKVEAELIPGYKSIID